MTSPVPTADRVAALSEEHAVATLALVLARQGLTVDPFTQDEQQAHLREALAQPEITASVAPEPGATHGDLARTALTQLAESDDTTRGLIEQAIDIAPRAERDPTLMLGVGALVLLAFRADIDIAHEPGKGWKFRFRTKGLSDSVIGKLLGQLLGTYLNPNG
ncbi:MAG: hypothetical protein M3Z25_07045 [Actinomycetota bacterium]|nr:hypothetical protein [Actinomycetota bacterium]